MTALQNKYYSGHHKVQRKRAAKEHLEERAGKRNVDNRLQVQLEENGGGSTRQSWMERSGLWPVFHWEQQDISQLIMYQYWQCMYWLVCCWIMVVMSYWCYQIINVYHIYQRPPIPSDWWHSGHRLIAIYSPLSEILTLHVVCGSSFLEIWASLLQCLHTVCSQCMHTRDVTDSNPISNLSDSVAFSQIRICRICRPVFYQIQIWQIEF